MFRLLTLFSVLGIAYGAAVENRVIKGKEIDIKEVPYQVTIQMEIGGEKKHHCGGSIISREWILTAAQCVNQFPNNEIFVGAGSSIISETTVIIGVSQIDHQLYNDDDFDYDVALVKLEEKLNYSDTIQPVKLPSKIQNVPGGIEGLVTGWGEISEKSEEGSNKLLAAKITTMDQTECFRILTNEIYNDYLHKDNQFCCEQKDGKDSYQEVSGDPFVSIKEKIQLGVVSWRTVWAREERYPGVYADISSEKIRNWIKEKTGI